MASSGTKPHASYVRYRQFQERQQQQGRPLSIPGPARTVAAAKVAFNAWKGYLHAAQGWYKAATEEGYSLDDAIPDMLAFQAGWWEAAKGVCDVLCHEPATLETDEDSETAGPVTVAKYGGVASDLEVSPLTTTTTTATIATGASGNAIPVACVMLRVRAGELTVSLVGFKRFAQTLPAGTYHGEIKQKRGGNKVSNIVVVHRRKGRDPRLTFRSGART